MDGEADLHPSHAKRDGRIVFAWRRSEDVSACDRAKDEIEQLATSLRVHVPK